MPIVDGFLQKRFSIIELIDTFRIRKVYQRIVFVIHNHHTEVLSSPAPKLELFCVKIGVSEKTNTVEVCTSALSNLLSY